MANETEALEATEARGRIARHEAFVVDVQDEKGWVTAHLVGATHVDGGEIGAALEDVPDDRLVIVVCADGKRSGEVAEDLAKDGREAASISGGISAWLSEGFQVQPSEDAAPPRDEDAD